MKKIHKEYTDDDLINIAKQFNSVKDFRTQNLSAYQASYYRGLDFFNNITSHMSTMKIKWDKNKLFLLLPNYKSYQDFYKNNDKAYQAARKLNLLRDVKKYYDDLLN